MTFQIDPRVFGKYPSLLVGVLVCKGMKNGPASAEVTKLLREAEALLRGKYQDPETLKIHPSIAAWQEVHRAFESNPNKFPSSIHALCKRAVKGSDLPSINTLVDLYNVISLRHMLPVGGEDADRKFNWRESARTCLTESTSNAVLVIEAVAPKILSDLEIAVKELEGLVMKYCGGTVLSHILDSPHLSTTI